MPETLHNSYRSGHIYRCPATVSWAVEDDGILLVNRKGGSTRLLGYPEAAVWELLVRGYSFERLLPLIGAICALDSTSAENLVRANIERWEKAGYLEKAGDYG